MLLTIFKWICYAALALLAGSFFGMLVLSGSGDCTRLSSAAIKCSPGIAQTFAELSFGILLVSVFTGIPAFLALGGVIFAIRALWKRFGPKPPDWSGLES